MKEPTTTILVSVCMVTFNHEAFIAQAIEGVLMQQGDFDLQLIIGDDASQDKTGDICKRYAEQYPSKIIFLRNEKNLGPGLNFYQIIKKCSGAYIALCEGDDYWTDPAKLQKQISFLQKNSDYAICFHAIKILRPDGQLVKDFITHVPKSETTIHDLIARGNYIHTPSVVLRNTFILPEWYLTCPVGDYALYLLAVNYDKIKYLDDSMAVYRYGGRHSSAPPGKARVACFVSYQELAKNYPDKKIRNELLRKQNRSLYIFLLKYFLAGQGDRSDFKKMLSLFFSSKINFFLRKAP